MLSRPQPKQSPEAVRKYLSDTLGPVGHLRPWPGASKLPYFLQDGFSLYEVELLDRPILLAFSRHRNTSLATIRERLATIKNLADRPVAYVTPALASYERKRLINQKVPFVVPGNQLYLPDIGVDLREYFRQQAQAPQALLSPATQAMVIKALLQKETQATWHPAKIIAELGYTAMTLSRAIKELTAAEIATPFNQSKARWLRMNHPPAETWALAKPLLRNPVKQSIWTTQDPQWERGKIPLAGLSALAHYSKLGDPEIPVYAASTAEWKAAALHGHEELNEPFPDGCQLQVWSYEPGLRPKNKLINKDRIVDPLSLTLSFQNEPDERVQLALEELKEHYPW